MTTLCPNSFEISAGISIFHSPESNEGQFQNWNAKYANPRWLLDRHSCTADPAEHRGHEMTGRRFRRRIGQRHHRTAPPLGHPRRTPRCTVGTCSFQRQESRTCSPKDQCESPSRLSLASRTRLRANIVPQLGYRDGNHQPCQAQHPDQAIEKLSRAQPIARERGAPETLRPAVLLQHRQQLDSSRPFVLIPLPYTSVTRSSS